MHIISNEQSYCFDPINYKALLFLEALGNIKPSQNQIDEAEIIIRHRLDDCILQFKFLYTCSILTSISGKLIFELIQFLTTHTDFYGNPSKVKTVTYTNNS